MAFQHIDSFVEAVYTVFAEMLNPEMKEVKAESRPSTMTRCAVTKLWF